MRAVVLEDVKKLTLVEMEPPKADGNRVILKISKVGICGSDIHMWQQCNNYKGLVMGHEFSGTVVDPGSREDLKPGDRVTVMPLDPCGKCELCKSGMINLCSANLLRAPGVGSTGAYAEYFAAIPDYVFKVPDTMTDEEAAMLEPAGVALRAVRRAGVSPGDKVLIAGGGIIGLLAAAFAKAAGASYIAITEANPLRKETALKMGDVNEAFDATDEKLLEYLHLASSGGFDQFIDCAGVAPAINTGIMAVKKGGRVILTGINFELVPISTLMVVLNEIELKGTFGYINEFKMAMELISKKVVDVKRFVSGTVGLDGVQEAMERLQSGKFPDIKIFIKP